MWIIGTWRSSLIVEGAQGFNTALKWYQLLNQKICKSSYMYKNELYRIFEKDGVEVLVDEITLEMMNKSTIEYK